MHRVPQNSLKVKIPLGLTLLMIVALVLLGQGPCIQAQASAEAPGEVVLVIDNSGSMRKNDPAFRMPKTVLAFLDQLPAATRVAMVGFDQQARLLQPLSILSNPATRSGLADGLKKEDIVDVLNLIQALLLPSVDNAAPMAAGQTPPGPTAVTAPPVTTEAPPSAPPAASTGMPETTRPFLTFYLPLLLILIVLIVGLAVRLFKRSRRPARRRESSKPPMPISVMDMTPPPWELQAIDDTGAAIHRFGKAHITVGRDGRNDLMLSTPTVSNLHAIIEYRNGAFFLEDQRSTNGTRLNGRPVSADTPVRLKSGDRIQFAGLVFRFVRLDQFICGHTVLLDITALGSQNEEPPSIHSAVAESGKRFEACLTQHLARIRALGEKYNQFVETCFPEAMKGGIATQAWENLQQMHMDPDQGCSSMIKGSVFYVICALPVPPADASRWFGERHGGFTAFISRWIKSDGYNVTACDLFCVIAFGMQQSQPWVSLTVIPTHDESHPVEIMSVDFLSDEEKKELGLEFDDCGRAR